jgi:maleate cis-trans isomerase
MRPGGIEELIRLLPDGICLLPLFLDIRKGTVAEFERAVEPYEPLLDKLAEAKVDLLHPEGAPPFMLKGYQGECDIIKRWEDKYQIPIFTSGSNQVRALKALGIKKFVGVGYDFDDMAVVERYFTDAGFHVLGLERLPGRWEDIGRLSSHEIYRLIRQAHKQYSGADGVYIQGGKIRMLDMVEALEQDLRIPVLHPGVATAWEILLRLGVHAPRTGYGRLLADLPQG